MFGKIHNEAFDMSVNSRPKGNLTNEITGHYLKLRIPIGVTHTSANKTGDHVVPIKQHSPYP